MRNDDAPDDYPEERVIYREVVRREEGSKWKSPEGMLASLIVASILGLVGTVMVLRDAVTAHTITLKFQAELLAQTAADTRQNTSDIRRIEGRTFRSDGSLKLPEMADGHE